MKIGQKLSWKFCQSFQMIFPKRHCGSLLVKGLQSYELSMLNVWHKFLLSSQSQTICTRRKLEFLTIGSSSSLKDQNFAALCLIETHSTSLEQLQSSRFAHVIAIRAYCQLFYCDWIFCCIFGVRFKVNYSLIPPRFRRESYYAGFNSSHQWNSFIQ